MGGGLRGAAPEKDRQTDNDHPREERVTTPQAQWKAGMREDGRSAGDGRGGHKPGARSRHRRTSEFKIYF